MLASMKSKWRSATSPIEPQTVSTRSPTPFSAALSRQLSHAHESISTAVIDAAPNMTAAIERMPVPHPMSRPRIPSTPIPATRRTIIEVVA